MRIDVQIICIAISFLYGIFIKLLNILNDLILKKYNIYINIICNLIYTYFIVLLYIIIIYKINKGIFHIYFLLVFLLGYYFMSRYVKFITKAIINFFYKLK